MSELTGMYTRVADAFCAMVNRAFSSEEELKLLYSHYTHAEFDRTDRWPLILGGLLRAVWKLHGPAVTGGITAYDRQEILRLCSPYLSDSTYSQVLLNLQPNNLLLYSPARAQKSIDMQEKMWAKAALNPCAPKAKPIKTPTKPDELLYNDAIRNLRTLRMVASANSLLQSFRVSPEGSTPALTDSANLSMLGPASTQFFSGPYTHATLRWEDSYPIVQSQDDGTFLYKSHRLGTTLRYTSKSGGSILNDALTARFLHREVYTALQDALMEGTAYLPIAFIPRMKSLFLTTDLPENALRPILDNLLGQPSILNVFGDRLSFEIGSPSAQSSDQGIEQRIDPASEVNEDTNYSDHL
jgi:hypothetical protein